MSTRRRAREVVLQALYEDDLNPEQDSQVVDGFIKTRLHANKRLVEFAHQLLANVLRNRTKIDKALSEKAHNWSIRRMAAIDRNILRLGACEILFAETPGRVAINEAVELAKRYGDRQSKQFVNGILDRILKEVEPDSEETPEPEAENALSS
jgi:N utilization substance protein B